MKLAVRMIRDRRRSLIWWSVALVALVLMNVALYPTIEGQAEFDRLITEMPPALKALFGISDVVPLTSPAGYLQGQFFGNLLPVLLVVFGIGLGAAAIAGSEQDGTLELLLSNPVTRPQVLRERYVAVIAMLGVVTAVFSVSVYVLSLPFGAVEGIPLVGLAAACLGAFLIALLHATVAFTAGALTGRRAVAIGVAAALAVGGFFLQGIVGLSDVIHPLRLVTPWHWYLGRNMLAQGVAPDALLAPIAVCAVLFPIALIAFNRRDLR